MAGIAERVAAGTGFSKRGPFEVTSRLRRTPMGKKEPTNRLRQTPINVPSVGPPPRVGGKGAVPRRSGNRELSAAAGGLQNLLGYARGGSGTKLQQVAAGLRARAFGAAPSSTAMGGRGALSGAPGEKYWGKFNRKRDAKLAAKARANPIRRI